MIKTTILYGKVVADSIKEKLSHEIAELLNQNIVPKLAAIIVGNDPASEIYVNSKHKTFQKFNCNSEVYKFESDIKDLELIDFIEKLNKDKTVHGILVQLPLPKRINSEKVLNSINPNKDVDGFHPVNMGLLLKGSPYYVPCTPLGCIEILKYYKINIKSKHIVIVGRSNIVGKPLMNLLSGKYDIGNATVTICHTGTKDISQFTKIADIIIAAVGKPNLINKTMIKEGVDIIDVGINRVSDNSKKGYKIVGDVDCDDVIGKANSITPVPGGVGPMTITMLLYNTIKSAKNII